MIAQFNGARRIQCPWCPVGLRRSLFLSTSAFGQHAAAKHPEKIGHIPEDAPNKLAACTDLVEKMFPNLAAFPDAQPTAGTTANQPAVTAAASQLHASSSAAPTVAVQQSTVGLCSKQQQATASIGTGAAAAGATRLASAGFQVTPAPFTPNKAQAANGLHMAPPSVSPATTPGPPAPAAAHIGGTPVRPHATAVAPQLGSTRSQGNAGTNDVVPSTPSSIRPVALQKQPVTFSPTPFLQHGNRSAATRQQAQAATSTAAAAAAAVSTDLIMTAVPAGLGGLPLPVAIGRPGAVLAYPGAQVHFYLPSPTSSAPAAQCMTVGNASMPTAAAAAAAEAFTARSAGAQAAKLSDEQNLGAFTEQADELLQVLFSYVLQDNWQTLRLVNKYFASGVMKHHVKQAGRLGMCLAALQKLLPSAPAAAAGDGSAATAAAAAADDYELLTAGEGDDTGAVAAAAAAPQQQSQQQLGNNLALAASLKVNAYVVQGSRTYEVNSIESNRQQLKFIDRIVASVAVQNRQQGGVHARRSASLQQQQGQSESLVQELEQQQQDKQQLLSWLSAAPSTTGSSSAQAGEHATVLADRSRLEGLLDYVIPKLSTNTAASAVAVPQGLGFVNLDSSSVGSYVLAGRARATAGQSVSPDNSVMLFAEITARNGVDAGAVWERLVHGGVAGWIEKVLPVGVGMSVGLGISSGTRSVVQLSRLRLQGEGVV